MNHSSLEFLQNLLRLNGSKYKVTEMNDQIFVDHPVCQEMVNRFINGETAIVPYESKNETLWLCLQKDEQTLTIDYSSLKKFILPYRTDEQDIKRFFVKQTSELGRLGSEVFPNGYYMFKSSIEKEAKIWDSLKLWLTVVKRKPTIVWQESVVNAFTLRNKFRNHLEMMEWSESEQTLNVIREGHYVSDENYLFLYVELLATQNKWKDIWYWKEFESLSGLQRIPKEVKIALLSAFYFVNLGEHDIKSEFDVSYEKFKTNRFRLNTLLDSHLGIQEDHIYRIFAYDSAFQQNDEKLLFIKNQIKQKDTLQLIAFLENHFPESIEPKVQPIVSSEEMAKEFLLNGQFDDAYLTLTDCNLSKEKIGMLSVIGFETSSSEIQKEAYEFLLQLPQALQDELMADNKINKYVMFVRMVNEGIQQKPRQEDMNYTWNHWFQKVLEVDNQSLDPLYEVLYEQEKLPNFIWSPSMISELGNLIVEVALSSFDARKKAVLNEGIAIFIAELTRDKEEFPRIMAVELYQYAIELLLLHGNKNKINTNNLNRLLEGLLQLNMLDINKYWDWASQWYSITPVKIMVPNLLFTLELFYDYGQDVEDLRNVWNQWTSTLLKGIATLSHSEILEWMNMGENIGGEVFFIRTLSELVEEDDKKQDDIELAPELSIVIFTLRENSARRAVEKLTKRNPKLKFRINVDTELTRQAKNLASNSDLVVLVTTAMKHALFYGITPYLKSDPMYPNSSGTSSIVAEIEKYLASVLAV